MKNLNEQIERINKISNYQVGVAITEQTSPIKSKTDSSKVDNQKYSKGSYEFNYLDDNFYNPTPTSRAELEITDVGVGKSPNDYVLVKVPTTYELYPVEGHPGVFSHPELKSKDGKSQYIKIYHKGE